MSWRSAAEGAIATRLYRLLGYCEFVPRRQQASDGWLRARRRNAAHWNVIAVSLTPPCQLDAERSRNDRCRLVKRLVEFAHAVQNEMARNACRRSGIGRYHWASLVTSVQPLIRVHQDNAFNGVGNRVRLEPANRLIHRGLRNDEPEPSQPPNSQRIYILKANCREHGLSSIDRSNYAGLAAQMIPPYAAMA